MRRLALVALIVTILIKLRWLAIHEPKAYATLLGKVMPTQITGEDGKAISIIINGKDADLL